MSLYTVSNSVRFYSHKILTGAAELLASFVHPSTIKSSSELMSNFKILWKDGYPDISRSFFFSKCNFVTLMICFLL